MSLLVKDRTMLSFSLYALYDPHKFFVIVSSGSCIHLYRLLGMINRVKSSSRLQRLKQSYPLTYYQKEWDDRTKNNTWYSLPKDHSFDAYCAYNTHFYLVHTRILLFARVPLSPVCPYVNIHVFGLCLSVCVPLPPVR